MSGSNSETQLLKILCRSDDKAAKAESESCGGPVDGLPEEMRGRSAISDHRRSLGGA